MSEPKIAPSIADHVRAGLSAQPKTLPPILFYDDSGSDLFDRICDLEEYYLTRTETKILEASAGEMASACAAEVTVVELGSGSSVKTTLLLDALQSAGKLARYIAIDISEGALDAARQRLQSRYPSLDIRAMKADYLAGLDWVRPNVHGQMLLLYLGSNLGNYTPEESKPLLASMRAAAKPQDQLLLGVDMVKDKRRLEAAYDDRLGVTAEFNLNVLRRINRELGGHFIIERFGHRAIYNEHHQRIEMHLVSKVDQRVRIDALETELAFAEGETIHTENSYKYTPARLESIARGGGWRVRRSWTDVEGLFTVNLLVTDGGRDS
jgi:L-histidine Nalpha-methyltransferase